MFAYLILGATYAFAAAVQPGPLQTYLISQTLSNGWRRTLPAALSPLISDVPIIILTLFVLSRMPARFEPLLRCAGGVFLLYLAAGALKTWRTYRGPSPTAARLPQQTVLSAAVVNLLNPNPYLAWSLVLGPLLLEGWRITPAYGAALVVGFYATMVLTLSAIITLFAVATKFGPRIGRSLVGLSALVLAGFGGYQLWWGIGALLTG